MYLLLVGLVGEFLFNWDTMDHQQLPDFMAPAPPKIPFYDVLHPFVACVL